jgi:multiple sugar transport system substrate-binding protein
LRLKKIFLEAAMLRKFLAVLLIVLMLPVTSHAQETCDGEEVTLRLDDWSSGDRVDYMNQVLDAFMEENPCISVVTEPSVSDDANTRRLTQILSGTAPDLIGVGESWIPLYSEAGAFLDLTPYLEGENGFDPAEVFYEEVFNQGFYRDVPYAVAKDYSTSAFYINTSLFEAAGLPLPEAGWTWDDALDIALELTVDANGNNANSPDFDPENIVQYGMDIINDGWWRGYQSYLYSWDAHTISEDGTTTQGYLNSEEAVAAWEFYRDLVFEHHVAPSATEIGSVEGGRVQMFQDGQIAIGITFHGPWWQDVLNQTPDLEWAVVPLPAGPNGTQESAVMWMGWGINANTEHPEEAWQLLRYLTTEPGQRVFALKALSADRAVAEEMQRVNDPYWGVFLSESERLGTLDEQLNPYYGPCVFTPSGDLLTRVLSEGGDELDIQAELDALAEEADQCLAESAEAGVEAAAESE